jgi:hypothetical protein
MPLDRALGGEVRRTRRHTKGRCALRPHDALRTGARMRFGAEPSSKRSREADAREADAREADARNIAVGLWEHGAEAWYTLQDLHRAEAKKRSRMKQVLRDHRPQKAAASHTSSAHRALPGLLDALYTSESSGTRDSVHWDAQRNWYIHRGDPTGIVYLVPVLLAKDEGDVRALTGIMRGHTAQYPYKYALSEGLLIVQDQRPGCVRVKRSGSWEPATEHETFSYYDFLLRYPGDVCYYHFEKNAQADHYAALGDGSIRSLRAE